ncbi:DUF4244 domain-containing protein [Streptosporangium sandarakinum]
MVRSPSSPAAGSFSGGVRRGPLRSVPALSPDGWHVRSRRWAGRLSSRAREALVRRTAALTGPDRDRGMSTAEYAVGTIAACAFAALLFKVVTSPEVQEMISKLIKRALNVAG